jgi:hypothetical protein
MLFRLGKQDKYDIRLLISQRSRGTTALSESAGDQAQRQVCTYYEELFQSVGRIILLAWKVNVEGEACKQASWLLTRRLADKGGCHG